MKTAFLDMTLHPTITTLNASDIPRIEAYYVYSDAPLSPPEWAGLTERITDGRCVFVMASDAGQDVGSFYLNWEPKYHVYAQLKIPELQDLRVLPTCRQQGVATSLLRTGEGMAQAAGCAGLGLAVGLSAEYGAAQRLYAKLGYVPDGQGVTYDRASTQAGKNYRLDDNFCLMLLKFF